MKKVLGLFALLAFSGLPAMAQYNSPVAEVGGGYTFRSFGFGSPNINMNGWNATAQFNVTPWVSAAGDFDGTYSNQGSGGNGWLETYLFGPRIYPLGHHKIAPFAHALFGGSHISINIPPSGGGPFTVSDTGFAWEVGGGLDVGVSGHFAVRLGEFDYEQTRFFGGNPNQSNYKFKAGILFRF